MQQYIYMVCSDGSSVMYVQCEYLAVYVADSIRSILKQNVWLTTASLTEHNHVHRSTACALKTCALQQHQ
jgi:flagellar biosynthesis/type III secretory pathway ATPase